MGSLFCWLSYGTRIRLSAYILEISARYDKTLVNMAIKLSRVIVFLDGVQGIGEIFFEKSYY